MKRLGYDQVRSSKQRGYIVVALTPEERKARKELSAITLETNNFSDSNDGNDTNDDVF
jgi:hypothetical protein